MKSLQILFIVGLTLLAAGCDPPEAFQPLSPEVLSRLKPADPQQPLSTQIEEPVLLNSATFAPMNQEIPAVVDDESVNKEK